MVRPGLFGRWVTLMIDALKWVR